MSEPTRAYSREEATPNAFASDEGYTEIDLIELIYWLLERWKWIALSALLCCGLSAFITTYMITPMYESTAKLYVMNSGDSAINLSDLQIGAYLTNDYQEVFKTWEVHEEVLSNLGLDYSYEELEDMLTISNPSDTRILYISVKSPSPSEAWMLANEYAAVAKKYIHDTMDSREPNILSEALMPIEPVSPSKALNLALGFLGGAVLACAIFVVQFVCDDKIKTADDIRKYCGMETLAVVPTVGKYNKTAKAYRARARRKKK